MSGGTWWTVARYRWMQGWSALLPRLDESERAAAMACLPGPARVVFRSMPIAFQSHHLAVYRRLVADGSRNSDVLAAALLHDIGKVDGRHNVSTWQRVVVVLVRYHPDALARLSDATSHGWRYGFYLHLNHPTLGARQAAALGCSNRTVALIAAHQDGASFDSDVRALRAADNDA